MEFKNISDLMDTPEDKFQLLNGIGETVASGIVSYFQNQDNRFMVRELLNRGVNIIYPEKINAEASPIKGLKIVFTGKAEKFSRDEFTNLVRKYGGTPSDSVSKNTDILVVGENAGSKLEKAKTLGIKIITDKEFLEMLQ